MSDQTAGPLEWRQHYADDIETIQTHLDGRQAQIHTAMPGSIVSFDATKMTASVQIGLQALQKQIDGSITPLTIQPVSDVPVHFPSGGGHTLTFPVKAGDECLVVFAERSIDNWFQHGGTQQPSDYRMHDINDCFVLVGARSQPNVLSNVNTTAAQLRSDDGSTVITLDGPNQGVGVVAPKTMTISVGAASSTTGPHQAAQLTMGFDAATGNLLVTAPGVVSFQANDSITLDTPTVFVTGSIACYGEVVAQSQTAGFVTLSKHQSHTGGNRSPTPGT